GMTLAEVEAVLGCKPGNYTLCDRSPTVGLVPKLAEGTGPFWIKVWTADKRGQWTPDLREPRRTNPDGFSGQEAIIVTVSFDRYGKVVDKLTQDLLYTAEPVLYHIRKLVRTIAPRAL